MHFSRSCLVVRMYFMIQNVVLISDKISLVPICPWYCQTRSPVTWQLEGKISSLCKSMQSIVAYPPGQGI